MKYVGEYCLLCLAWPQNAYNRPIAYFGYQRMREKKISRYLKKKKTAEHESEDLIFERKIRKKHI